MRTFFRELLWWAAAMLFAGIMLVGFFAEISVSPWLMVALKIILSFVGFAGCYWASNHTSFGRKVAGQDY